MSIEKIADIIKQNNSFAIVVHQNPDGDCLGSAAALLTVLRNMGKRAFVAVDGVIPERLSFLWRDDYFGGAYEEFDVCIAVDVAAEYMMGEMKKKIYDRAKITCCLDHHGTNSGYAQYNFVDANASAAGEVIYSLIKEHLRQDITTDIARALYTAVASDTGSFRYSNTTSRTHLIASELIKYDIDAPFIMRVLFEQKTIQQLKIKGEVISNLEFYENNRICVAKVDRKLLEKYNITFEQTDDLASLPRSVKGVEVGVYMKIKSDNEVKISLRSNECADVSKAAAALGGGGHTRAAGVTVNKPAEEALELVLGEIKKVM